MSYILSLIKNLLEFVNRYIHMNKEIDITDNIQLQESISIARRTYTSIAHLESIIYFCEHSNNFENTPIPTNNDEHQKLLREHKTCVISGIISSVLFLESNINEFYRDANEYPDGSVKGLDEIQIKRIANIDKTNTNAFSGDGILKKYTLALTVCDKDIIGFGTNIYGNVKIVIQIRNFLTHNFPETVYTNDTTTTYSGDNYSKLTKKLDGKFELNKLLPHNPIFPDRTYSTGCVKWCFKSVIDFADLFYDKLAISKPYDHIRPKFNY